MQIAIYPVADLVIRNAAVRRAIQGGESLLEHLRKTAAPKSWEEDGGAASIVPHPQSLALVVVNTSDAHGEIADVLAQLRQG